MKIFKTLSSILVTSVLSVTVIPSTFASTESTATNQTQQTVLLIILTLKLRALPIGD